MRYAGVLRAVAALLTVGVPMAAQQNGIYVLAEDGPVVTAKDSSQVHLGARRSFQIRESNFMPRNNENSDFGLWIAVPENPGLGEVSHALLVDGVAYRQGGSGVKEGGLALLVFSVQGAESARRIAAYLGASPNFRRPPEHKLRISFVPASPRFQLGSDVRVKMKLKNTGDQPVAFMANGGRSHVGDPFDFTVRYQGRYLGRLQRGICADCLDWAPTLKPGEVFEREVNLSEWYWFHERGTYLVHGSFFLDLRPVVNRSRYTLWEEYISADFRVIVK